MNKDTSVNSLNLLKKHVQWHRRIGLSIFVFLVVLAITGVALNHTRALRLDRVSLSNSWLLSWYGIEKPSFSGFSLNDHWLYHDDNEYLILDMNPVALCQPPLISAASNETRMFALCADSLVILSANGELIEKFTNFDGLPNGTSAVISASGGIYLLAETGAMQFNSDTLALTPAADTLDKVGQPAIASQPLPRPLMQYLQQQGSGPSVSLETVILDLHSGRFFGQIGVWVVDIVGLLIIVLSITGLSVWVKRSRINRE